jgi:alkylation response protein AidB-like acyl-CoA dehydrogenase
MDLELGDEQRMLVEAARAFVARSCPAALVRKLEASEEGFSREHWHAMGALGWPGIVLPEQHGGGGRGVLELALVCEALGRGPVPSPLIASATLAALPVLWAGTEAQRARWLPGLASGEIIGAMALVEEGARDEREEPAMEAERGALSGTKLLVPFAAAADVLLVSARAGEGTTLFAVDPRRGGVLCDRIDAIGGDPLYAVTFDGVEVGPEDVIGPPGRARPVIDRALDHAGVAGLASMVGAAERTLEITTEHAGSREQFGRPIGAFQAVAHRCVDMRADIDALRYLVYQAAWMLQAAGDAALAVGAAAAYGSDALRRIFVNAHQVHGAIGFSMEHDLQLFSRRAKAFELTLGSAGRHRERVARAMGL